ncbi:hypothetical protein V2J09_023021 [Rumex salicifolius]
MVCCGYGGPPLNYDSRVNCGRSAVLNGTSVISKGCNESSRYVNWDGIHYTEAANQHVASQILSGNYASILTYLDDLPGLLFFPMILLIISVSIPRSASLDLDCPAVFNFGDSNSDTGNLPAGLGFSLVPPYGQAYFGNQTARFCNGRLIVDFLMYGMNLPFLNAYLESIGTPNFHTGINFAAAGSTIHPATAYSICPFSFGVQVSQFLRFKARVLAFLSQSDKLDKYLPAEDYFYKGLYMFDIGQNDLAGAFYSKSYDDVLALIPSYLAEFQAGVERLYYGGARNLWIHNTGPLGCLAHNIAKFGTSKSMLDEIGCVQTHNQAAKAFNQQLHDHCQKLQGQFTDINITYVDVFSIKLDLIANHSKYGFEEPIMVCCGYGGPPLNYDSRVGCGEISVLNGTSVSAKGCNESNKYVSWDGTHYTEAANQHVASQILTGNYASTLT